MVDAFTDAARKCLPEAGATKGRPWVSEATLELIALREETRRTCDHEAEKRLHGRIKAAVKADRSKWLDEM